MSPARSCAPSISGKRPTRRRERFDRARRSRLGVAGAVLASATVLASAALAHPGSGIAIDRQGRVFFVDTGVGVWVVERDGALHRHDGPAFHWMTIDPASRFGDTRFTHLPSSDMRAVGRDPMVLLSSDYPITVGSDGALYFPEPGADRRLHLVRMQPSGERSDLALLPAESDGGPLQWLNGVAAGADGSIYYSENASVRRIDARGAITTVAGRIEVPGGERVPGMPEELGPMLRGLAVSGDGTVYVAASACRALVEIGADGAIVVRLRAEAPYSPTAVAVEGAAVYVLEYTHTADEPRDRKVWVPRVRRLAPDGAVTLVVEIER
jgi:hypothetical protein